MKPISYPLLGGLIFCVVSAACSLGPNVQATATAQQMQTQSASIVSTTAALSATQTALAMPTLTPSVTPSQTPAPTATRTPGPLVIDDDFSNLSSRWQGCDICSIKGGALVVGPYPSSNSAKGYITLCKECGVVREYKMSVDATFISGVSDRGFGFVVREANGSFIDLEITTWQLYGVWFYDVKGGDAWNAWHPLLSKPYMPTGYLLPGVNKNHIAVEVVASDSNKNEDLIKISFNGTLLNTVEIPKGAGYVGLAVGLHSIGVAFDNFHFEGTPLVSTGGDSGNSG